MPIETKNVQTVETTRTYQKLSIITGTDTQQFFPAMIPHTSRSEFWIWDLDIEHEIADILMKF